MCVQGVLGDGVELGGLILQRKCPTGGRKRKELLKLDPPTENIGELKKLDAEIDELESRRKFIGLKEADKAG